MRRKYRKHHRHQPHHFLHHQVFHASVPIKPFIYPRSIDKKLQEYTLRLKKLEKGKARWTRIRTANDMNITAALHMDYPTSSLADPSRLMELSRSFITEHCQRRIDLFFYTCVAYYQTNVIPIKGHTNLQHGKGRNTDTGVNITQAAHSSLIAQLLDNNSFRLKTPSSIIANTHFLDSLNSTVEVPVIINKVDDLIEAACRETAMHILQQVACGLLDPIQATNALLVKLDQVFADLKLESAQIASQTQSNIPFHTFFGRPMRDRDHVLKTVHQYNLISLLEKSTFDWNTDAHHHMTPDYIQSLLRLSQDEHLRQATPAKCQAIYLAKMIEIKNEILTPKTTAILQ